MACHRALFSTLMRFPDRLSSHLNAGSFWRRGRLGAALALVLVLAIGEPAVKAATISTEYRDDGGAIVIEATATIDASPATVWSVLTDYARYPEFMPGARDARIVRRTRALVTVEQSWSLAFGPLRVPLEVVYDIVEMPPDKLQSSGIVGSVGTLRSRYTVEASGQGAVLRYDGRFASTSMIAFALGAGPARDVMSSQFRALVDEIERLARTHASPRLPSRTAAPTYTRRTETSRGERRAGPFRLDRAMRA